jgi:hypothetical protein
METIDRQKYIDDIVAETKNSSTLRLLREITRWDEGAHPIELEIIAREINTRLSLKKSSMATFIICFIMSNLGNSFSEHFYVFDEDEKEIRRQLKNDIITHLTILTLISCSSLLVHYGISLSIISLYILWTIKMTYKWYRPIHEKLKKSATNP